MIIKSMICKLLAFWMICLFSQGCNREPDVDHSKHQVDNPKPQVENSNPQVENSNPQPDRRNVVLISIDTLRADHLGSWGFPDGYSPTLDRLARQGLIRESTYTVIPHTTPAHSSLLTGRYPINHGSRDNAVAIRSDIPTLAEIFKTAGYATAGSAAHFLLSTPSSGLSRGFDDYHSPPEPGMHPGKTDDGKTVFPLIGNAFLPWQKVNQHARKWIQTAPEPHFLFLHYYECHEPYNSPSPLSKLSWLAPYDAEIAEVDSAVADVLDMIAAAGILNHTEINITADHGESLGEHSYFGHGKTLNFPSMLIPWITWNAGIPSEIRSGMSRIIDIMPTILKRRQIPCPAGLDGEADSIGVTEVFGESPSLFADEPQRRIRSIRNEHFTLINQKNVGRTELFNTETDPGENVNLADLNRAEAELLQGRINQFVQSDSDDFLKPERALRPEVVEALKALGYLTP